MGKRTAYQYGEWLTVVGMIVIVVGTMGLVGGGGISRGTLEYQYGESAGQEGVGERTRQLVKDIAQSYAFTVRTTVVGIIAIGVGILLQECFG
jgi:hypothetical protein